MYARACESIHSPYFMLGHTHYTHSAYTHFSGTKLSGYKVEVLKIIRDRRFLQGPPLDEITGVLIEQSGQGRASVPFALSTHDAHFTDPVHLAAIFAAFQKKLDGGASRIALVYPHPEPQPQQG